MKKVLSMVLALALVLTTLVVPMTVSAATKLDGSAAITLTAYSDENCEAEAEATDVYRGQTIYVKATVDTTITDIDFYFDVNGDFTVGTLPIGVYAADGSYAYVGEKLTSTDLFVLPLTVDVDADIAEVAPVTLNEEPGSAWTASGYYPSVTLTEEKVNVKQYGVTITFDADTKDEEDGVELTTATDTQIFRNAEAAGSIGVTVSPAVYGESIATVVKVDDMEVTLTDGAYAVSEFDTYTVSVKVGNDTEVSRTINYKSEGEVAFSIGTGYEKQANGVAFGGTIEVPVVISGMGEGDTAALVAFDVTYESSLVTLDETDLSIKDGTVTVGAVGGDANIANDATVATLKFTANTGIVGDVTITIDNFKYVLTGDYNTEEEATDDSIEVIETIVPTGAYATVSKTYTGYQNPNAEYTETITVDSSVTGGTDDVVIKVAKYATDATVETDSQDKLKAIFEKDGATEVEDNKVKIDETADYYVVAKIGSVYKLVAVLDHGVDVFFDGGAPTITCEGITTWTMWADDLTVDVVLGDALQPETVTATWAIGDETGSVEEGKISIPKMTVNAEDALSITATDASGNKTTSTFELKVDADAPVIVIGEVGGLIDKKKTIPVTVTDAGAGVSAVKVYYDKTEGAEEKTELTDITALTNPADVSIDETDGTGSYDAELSGWYYFVAEDEVGNTSFDGVYVSTEKTASVANLGVGFKVLDSDEVAYKANGFVTKDYLATTNFALKSNGTFTYVAIKEGTTDTSHSVTYKLTYGDNEETLFTNAEAAEEVKELTAGVEAVDYVLTVTVQTNGSTDDVDTQDYVFTVAPQAKILSVDGDYRFKGVDYGIMRRIGENADTTILNFAEDFVGGYFAGDVDGNLSVEKTDAFADASTILNQMTTSGKLPKNYVFPIFNIAE